MRFDIQDQRGLAFAFGLVGLTTSMVVFYVTGKSLPGELTGAFLTMVMGPVVGEALERSREQQRQESQGSPSTPPPSSSQPRKGGEQ